MFYYLFYPLRDQWIVFNLFRYITFRSAAASLTAFFVCLYFGPAITEWLRSLSAIGSTQREHAEKLHALQKEKGKVPTMGGILIILGILMASVLWGNLSNRLLLICMVTLVWFGMIGFIDDYLKVVSKSTKGLRSLSKLAGQVIWGIVLGWYLFRDPNYSGILHVPFLKHSGVYLGIFYVPFVILVLAGASNAVNLTDGLDGLAIGCSIFAAGAFGIISYVSGHAVFAEYLKIPFFSESGELTVFCSSMAGAGAGFLWYNAYPATIFMGDTGSLSLGGALGAVAVCIKKELVLLIVGGVFVWEALSVILQVTSFKLHRKRIFKMAPFHHHLQLLGWSETKVTIRLWIVAFLLAVIGLSTLKIR